MRFFAIVSVLALSGCSSESEGQKSQVAKPTAICPNQVTKLYEDVYKGAPISKEDFLINLQLGKSMSKAQLEACTDWIVGDKRFWEAVFPGEGSLKMAEYKSMSKAEQKRSFNEALAKFGQKVDALVSV